MKSVFKNILTIISAIKISVKFQQIILLLQQIHKLQKTTKKTSKHSQNWSTVFITIEAINSSSYLADRVLKQNFKSIWTKIRRKQATSSWWYTKTKFFLAVKSYNLRSYLKVYAGIKKKKSHKKFFLGRRKFVF